MGNIPIFQRQTDAITGIPDTRATPQDFGSATGEALQGLGNNLVGLGAAVREYQDRQGSIAGSLALSQLRMKMTGALFDMQNGAEAGAPGFTDSFLNSFDQAANEAGGGLPNNRKVQDAWKVGVASLRSELGTRAIETEAGQQSAQMAQNAQSSLWTGINTIQLDPTQYAAVVADAKKTIGALNMPEDKRVATEQEFMNSAIAARFNAMFAAAKTPDAVDGVIHDLRTGGWDKLLDAKTFDNMLDLAKAAKTSASALTYEVANQAVQSVEDRIKGGAVIDPSEMSTIAAQVKGAALSDPVKGAALFDKWSRLRVQYDTTQKTKGMSTPALKSYISTAAGGPVDASTVQFAWRNDGPGSGYAPVATSDARFSQVNPTLVHNVATAFANLGLGTIKINSGFRDPAKNAAVGGAEHSQHLDGNALDIDVSDMSIPQRVRLIQALSAAGVQGIGVYGSAIHADMGSRRAWGPSYHSDSIPGWAKQAIDEHLAGKVAPGIGSASFKLQAPPEYASLYTQAGTTYGVDPGVLARQGAQESANFNPRIISGQVKSPAGAAGIAQFMPDTAARYGVNPLDPKSAIDGQGRMMRDLLQKYNGDYKLALAAYNWGEGNVDNWIKSGANPAAMPQETRNYVQKIMGNAPIGSTQYGWIRSQAAQNVLDTRNRMIGQGDMITAGQQAGLYTLSSLTNPADFASRGQQAATAAGMFSTEAKPFTPDEVTQFNQVMETGNTDQKLALLDGINGMGSNAQAAFKQLGEKSPLLGYVGGLAQQSPGIARDIIRGTTAMHDNPDIKQVLETGVQGAGTPVQFASIVGGALDGVPQVAAGARAAADALYVQRKGLAATGAFDSDAYAQAVRDVLGGAPGNSDGGVANVNGQPTLLPPGVSGDDFKSMLDHLTDADLTAHSVGGGAPHDASNRPIDAATVADEGKFHAIAAGAYTITLADNRPLAGSGPNGFYVFTVNAKDVQNIIQRPAAAAAPVSAVQSIYGDLNAADPPANFASDAPPATRKRAWELFKKEVGPIFDPTQPAATPGGGFGGLDVGTPQDDPISHGVLQ